MLLTDLKQINASLQVASQFIKDLEGRLSNTNSYMEDIESALLDLQYENTLIKICGDIDTSAFEDNKEEE